MLSGAFATGALLACLLYALRLQMVASQQQWDDHGQGHRRAATGITAREARSYRGSRRRKDGVNHKDNQYRHWWDRTGQERPRFKMQGANNVTVSTLEAQGPRSANLRGSEVVKDETEAIAKKLAVADKKKKSAAKLMNGLWWKEFLESDLGNNWFDQCNKLIQPKLTKLAAIAEREGEPGDPPFRVIMAGDSTMRHQYGALCGFIGERKGSWFDRTEIQSAPGCCMDTTEGGGRGICFELFNYRFLSPQRYRNIEADAFYFGSGLHLLHMTYGKIPLEPLRVRTWLAYEDLLEDEVKAVRESNGQGVRIIFMTTHTVADMRYRGDFATTRDAWRKEPGNSTIRNLCEDQVYDAANGEIEDFYYWEPGLNLDGYTRVGQSKFTVDTYCERALMDRQGSVQLNRRARPVMARLGVPLVDAGKIVDGEIWATKRFDGRHYHALVPMELFELLGALISPPPAPAPFTIRVKAVGLKGNHPDDDSE